jgi:membrane protein YqaA with SNARE-associated domain
VPSLNSAEAPPPRWLNGLAASWGAAEATLFFIVPDVLLSRIALQDRRRALRACLWALAGALAGGTLVWILGHADPAPTRTLFTQIPAIDHDMIRRVHRQILDLGAGAVFIGPLTGTPYKIYALEAAGAGVGLLPFLLVSVPARLLRFVAVVLLTHAVAAGLHRLASSRAIAWLHAAAWAAFYAWYFYVMSAP